MYTNLSNGTKPSLIIPIKSTHVPNNRNQFEYFEKEAHPSIFYFKYQSHASFAIISRQVSPFAAEDPSFPLTHATIDHNPIKNHTRKHSKRDRSSAKVRHWKLHSPRVVFPIKAIHRPSGSGTFASHKHETGYKSCDLIYYGKNISPSSEYSISPYGPCASPFQTRIQRNRFGSRSCNISMLDGYWMTDCSVMVCMLRFSAAISFGISCEKSA